ncbi:AraC-type DNA-binding protein [Robiginitalea myxolifaciens]|uniref:AraC-type DNA-binding protein n=1 Tax=Robiginitalea myxolifaciens TaxID=400055 RepID=A0A1I6FN79_9FLAO|nr:helix-turn-helix transcriptional regulator [Robiginitalea myxolifaciens]SFR31348.1 AraC-type DNA-binding protein [Robiginitalea myxolifaciens]
MNKLSIPDYRAGQLVNQLANELSLSVASEQREYSVSLSADLGKGYIKAFDFDHGISVYEFDCTFEQDFQLLFEKTPVQPLILLFNREEAIEHAFRAKEPHAINHLESLMVSAGLEFENRFSIKEKQSACFFALLVNRKEFENKISEFLSSMDEQLEGIFKDLNGVNTFYQKGHFSLDIAKFIEEFTTTDLTGFMRYVFLEGKVYEILTHFFQQFLDDANQPDRRKILRQSTAEKIEEAGNIIEAEMDALGSVISIAKRVGLNQQTLQEGFKKLYNKSVNQYIREVRLEKAKALMENTNLNITEITYRIGINSRSYFAKLFKDRFGVSPKDYISMRRKKDNSNLSA